MRPIGTIAGKSALAVLGLVAAAAVAQAQTYVTRQITNEPVETSITQGPGGTAVTRRILSPEPGIRTYAAPAPVYSPVATEAIEEDYVAPAAPPPRPRRVTTTAPRTVGQAPAHTRTATVRERPRPARTITVAAAPVSDQALVLSPAQRRIIYRSVVERDYYPAPVPAVPPVWAPADVYAPPPASGYPLRTVYPADADRAYAYDPYHDEYRETYPAYRRDQFVVGARIPASVPLYAVPGPVLASIPAAAPYSYALIDNRVFLVDPVTDVIVAEITQ
jgi:hypothetical protein